MIILRSLMLMLLMTATMVQTSPPSPQLQPRSSTVAYRAIERSAYNWALTQHGKPYEWGGTGPYGYDCSGLVMAAFAHAGENIPRSTYAMLGSIKLIPETAGHARRGDLAFYGPGHVEFYDVPGATYGAHDFGTRIGWTIYGPYFHPTAFYRVAAGGYSLAALVVPATVSYRVRRGDTLWSISAAVFGTPLDWRRLWAANRAVIGANPNLILTGEVLRYNVTRSFHRPRPVVPPARVGTPPVAPRASGGTLGCGGLASLWEAAGGAPGLAATMAGIAMAESGGRQYAAGDGGASLGYWQIDGDYSSLATYDPYGNARAAVIIEGENGLGAWSTYTSGAYAGRC